MEDVLINIGAVTKDFVQGLSDVGEKTKSANEALKGVGAEAILAFAGYTAAIMGTVYAYREEELIGQEVAATIQATGGIAGVTSEAVNHLAESLSKSTLFSKTQVEAAEAMLLTFTEISSSTFPQASQATLDLAQHMGGDARGAAQVLGRALQDPMAGLTHLRREGILFTEQQKRQIEAMELAGNIAGAQAVILKQVEGQYGGMSQAAAGGVGAVTQVKNAMEELAAHIGAVFAPYVATAAAKLRDIILAASQNQPLLDLIASFLSVGAAVTGAVTALVAGSFAVKQIISAIEVARIVTEAFGLTAKTAMGATGVGLILVVGLEIYAHWNQIWPAMQATFKAFCDHIGQAAMGVGKVLLGAFSLDVGLIKEGIAQAAAAFVQGFHEIKANLPAATPEVVHAATTAGHTIGTAEAKARQETIRREEANLRQMQAAAQRAAANAEIAQLEGHTKKVVDLYKQEAATLKQIADAKDKTELKDLQKHLKAIQKELQQAQKNEEKQKQAFNKLQMREGAQFTAQEHTQLMASIQTEQDAKHANDMADLQRQIDADNIELQEADRFGKAYAAIDAAMHSAVVQQTERSFSELSQVSQSGSNTLKSIGQGASAVEIEIKGAQAAMDIYAGFVQSLPPWIGIPLGIAGAAAAEIFAQEQEAKVLGLAEGGQIPLHLGIPGVDSVPVLAQPGEVFAPPQTFADLVASATGKSGTGGGAQKVQLQVEVALTGDAARFLQVKNVRDKALGTYRGT